PDLPRTRRGQRVGGHGSGGTGRVGLTRPRPAPPGSRSRPVEQREHGVGVLHPVLALDGADVVEGQHAGLPPVRPVPQHLRDLFPCGLLGRVPESAVDEGRSLPLSYGLTRVGKAAIWFLWIALLRRFPGSGAQVVGGHGFASTSPGFGIPGSVSHSRASIADAAMCDACEMVSHAPDEPKPTSVKSSSPGKRRVMLNSTRYSGRSSVVMSRSPSRAVRRFSIRSATTTAGKHSPSSRDTTGRHSFATSTRYCNRSRVAAYASRDSRA